MRRALESDNDVLKRVFGGFKSYLWLFCALFILYIILAPFVTLAGNSADPIQASTAYDGDGNVTIIIAILMVALLLTAFVLAITRKMTAARFIALLIAAGLILRFGYMLYTPFYIRGHDVSSYGGYGHLDYIFRLFNAEGLPATYAGQFYHPPLAHAADAAVARLYALITGIGDPDTIFESSRLIPCFASCALLVVCARLFDALGFSNRAKTVALAVIAFHPTFLLLSASINNDMLMVFFFVAAFLYTVRWYRDPSYKNILLIAIFIGCAMSAKFSGALIAVFTATIFLFVLIRHIREGKGRGLAGQFAAFAAVCLPLGLWYQIRNLVQLGQPLGYVAEIPTTSALYVGDKPFTERFFAFSLPDMLGSLWCYPFSDDRLWEYTVKCALFGEFVFSPKHDLVARILIVVNLALILLSLFAMVYFLFFDKRRNRFAILSLFAVWALLMLSFLFFNVKYPFGCTMDFRYIVPTVVAGAAFLGLLYDRLAERRHAVLSGAILAVLGVFCAASAVFYII